MLPEFSDLVVLPHGYRHDRYILAAKGGSDPASGKRDVTDVAVLTPKEALALIGAGVGANVAIRYRNLAVTEQRDYGDEHGC